MNQNSVSSLLKRIYMKLSINISYIFLRNRKTESNPNYVVVMDICKGSKGSFGDEAVLISAFQMLHKIYDKIIFIQYADNSGRRFPEYIHIISIPFMRKPYCILRMILNAKMAFFFGADIIDGSYGDDIVCWNGGLIECLRKLDKKVLLTNFSISENPSIRAKKILQNILKQDSICRDLISKERVQRMWGISIKAVPDMAFSMEHIENLIDESFLNFCKKKSKMIAGININLYIFEETERPVILANYAKLIQKMIEDGIRIVLIPHDIRPWYSDLESIDKLMDIIPISFHKDICVADVNSTVEVRTIISKLDFLFTGKMHAAVAALSLGIPCCIVGYLGKAEGLVKWFDLDSSVIIETKDALVYDQLENELYKNLETIEICRGKILFCLNSVKELSKSQLKYNE